MTATTAVGAAAGARWWLVSRRPTWMTVGRMRAATAALLALAVLAAGVRL